MQINKWHTANQLLFTYEKVLQLYIRFDHKSIINANISCHEPVINCPRSFFPDYLLHPDHENKLSITSLNLVNVNKSWFIVLI